MNREQPTPSTALNLFLPPFGYPVLRRNEKPILDLPSNLTLLNEHRFSGHIIYVTCCRIEDGSCVKIAEGFVREEVQDHWLIGTQGGESPVCISIPYRYLHPDFFECCGYLDDILHPPIPRRYA